MNWKIFLVAMEVATILKINCLSFKIFKRGDDWHCFSLYILERGTGLLCFLFKFMILVFYKILEMDVLESQTLHGVSHHALDEMFFEILKLT